METFAQQFFNLLVSPPGNLIYHLVLAFSITATIQAALGKHIKADKPRLRLVVGLSVLLLGQIVLFFCSGLAWQGMVNPRTFLPPLDRAIALFSLVWIFWLWAFPAKSRIGDILTGFLNLGILILLFLTISIWNSQPSAIAFNTSWWDWIWGLLAILLSLGGMLYLLIKRPSGWSMGLGMISLNLVGYVAHLTLMPASGDYAPLLRLAHICSYPLLPTLAQRLYEMNPPAQPAPEVQKQQLPLFQVDFPALRAWLEFISQEEPEHLCSGFSRALASSLKVDLTLLLSYDTTTNQVKIECGYNLEENKPVTKHTLISDQVPLLLDCVRKNAISLIKFNETTKFNLQGLNPVIELSEPTDILVFPFPITTKREIKSLLFLSPDGKREWSNEEQIKLQSLRETLVHLLQQTTGEVTQPKPVVEQQQSETKVTRLQQVIQEMEQKNKKMEEDLDQISTQYLTQQQENETLKTKFSQLQQDLLFFTSQSDTQDRPEESGSGQESSAAVHEDGAQNIVLEQIQRENQELQDELDRLRHENTRMKDLLEQLAIPDSHPVDNMSQEFLQESDEQSLDEVLNGLREESDQFDDVLHRLTKQTDRLGQNAIAKTSEPSETPSRDEEIEWELPGFMEPPAKEKTQPIKITKAATPVEPSADGNIHEALKKLQMENEMLFARLRETQQLNSADTIALENLNNELRQTLEKIAQLEYELEQANQKLEDVQEIAGTSMLSESNQNEIIRLITELIDPMSSMNGYMDMLLSENIGKLGAVHKRLVERMKAAFDRVGQLMSQLTTLVSIESETQESLLTAAGLNAAIAQALIDVDQIRLQKKLQVDTNVVEDFPALRIRVSDLRFLTSILLLAWMHAAENGSQFVLDADILREEGKQELILRIKGAAFSSIPEEDNEEIAELRTQVVAGRGQVTNILDIDGYGILQVNLPVN